MFQHVDLDKEYTVESDALGYVSAAVLFQPDHESILWPMAFMLYQHFLAECKYEIYNKKLLAIV